LGSHLPIGYPFLTKEYRMHEPLHDQTVHLLTLCTTLREGLRAADLPPLNGST